MKPVQFDYVRAETLDQAQALLGDADDGAKILAGGQSLGPMLNLRLVRPGRLVDITRIEELNRVEESEAHLELGACVRHAAIEDGKTPDVTNGLLPAVAANIAYRAIRNRGTIGGSLVHADPSADWVSCLALLDAEAVIHGAGGTRRVAIDDFITGVFETTLGPNEILRSVLVPRLGPLARWGFYKLCRRTGEFAHAMCGFLFDPDGRRCRVVIGATEGKPIVVADAEARLFTGGGGRIEDRLDAGAARHLMAEHGLARDQIALQIHLAALRRAVEQARRFDADD
jgi:aerobic carbon-monoxide dehydrogenase medium subunit